MDRSHLERLLREPNNLFGPEKGRGYDYFKAGLTALTLILATLSGLSLLTATAILNLPAFFQGVLLLLGAPFCLGAWFLWPINLLIGWGGAILLWHASLKTLIWLTRLRDVGRIAGVAWSFVAIVGWSTGIWLVYLLWR